MYRREYRRKLTTPEQAVADIADAATIVHGMATGEPPALLGAIADRVRHERLEGHQGLFPAEHGTCGPDHSGSRSG